MVKNSRTDPGRSRAAVGAIRYGTGSSPPGSGACRADHAGICGLFVVLENDLGHALGRLHQYYPGAELIEDQAAVASLFPRLTGFLYGHDDCHDLAIDFSSGTDFQRRVWESLRKIPRGETRSYGEVAQAIGHPGARTRGWHRVWTQSGFTPDPLPSCCGGRWRPRRVWLGTRAKASPARSGAELDRATRFQPGFGLGLAQDRREAQEPREERPGRPCDWSRLRPLRLRTWWKHQSVVSSPAQGTHRSGCRHARSHLRRGAPALG